MKDQRVAVFLTALDSLVESLEATVRIRRWNGSDPVPEPLQKSAAKLVERLGTATRLAGGKFIGSPPVALKVGACCEAIQKLEAAYVSYRRPGELATAARVTEEDHLEEVIREVKAERERWV